MARPASMIGFIDEAGVPDIPSLSSSRKALEPVFCIGFVFMPMHYWSRLREVYEGVRTDFGIRTDRELKWRNLLRGTGEAAHLQASGCHPFIEELMSRLNPKRFRAVCVTVVKEDVYNAKHYVREGQDIYNAAVLFALQRLQNEIDEMHGSGATARASSSLTLGSEEGRTTGCGIC